MFRFLLLTGGELESLYLYNPVSFMTLVGDDSQYLAVGMSGGKLKLYNLEQLRQEGITMSTECTIDTDRITCLHVSLAEQTSEASDCSQRNKRHSEKLPDIDWS